MLAMIRTRMIQLLVTVTLLDTTFGGPTRQYFVSSPENMIVKSGDHIRLSCEVNDIGVGIVCHWTRDGFILSKDREMSGYPRYHMSGIHPEDCSLRIDPALAVDSGVYQCIFGDLKSREVTLTVNSEPGQPYIVQARDRDTMKVERGEEIQLVCESQGGRPPAEIQWWDGNGRRIVSDVTEHVSRIGDGRNFKTTSTLKYKVEDEKEITCTAHNDAFPQGKKSHGIKVKVKGEPKKEVKELDEGDSIKISCTEDRHLEGVKFKWFINDIEIVGETQNMLEIQQFSKSYDNSKVKCAKRSDGEILRIVELVLRPTENPEPRKLETKKKERQEPTSEIEGFNTKKKTMFTCVVEEENITEPKYVWMDGKLVKKNGVVEVVNNDKKMRCKVVPKATKKITKFSADLKKISKTLRKFSKELSKLTTQFDEI